MPPSNAPPETGHRHTIVIVGAGFSGAVTAVQLLRRASGPLRVVLINESGRMARGLAYGTNSPDHVLNVPAGNMSALDDDAEDFLRYCRWANPQWHPSSFVPRQLYGAYLEALLTAAESGGMRPSARFERIAARVTGIQGQGSPLGVRLDDGRVIDADQVVLAFGHFAPLHPLRDDQLASLGERYIADPWRMPPAGQVSPDDTVLLLGTGLSALDVVISLAADGHRGRIVCASRRGLPPQPHRAGGHGPAIDGTTVVAAMGTSLRGQVRVLRQLVREAMARGDDWRDWIAALRPHTPALWRSMSASDRRRFLRHLQAYWDVHRHRCAPQAQAPFQQLLADGQLTLCAARVAGVAPLPDGAQVDLDLRGNMGHQSLKVQWVVNCTGPSSDVQRCSSELVRSLLESGRLQRDALGLGIEVASNYAVLDASGRPQAALRYIGPLLKARDWEATAVPELRRHAAELAHQLLEDCHLMAART